MSADRVPLVLGIETSCDETGIGIVRGTELLANVIASSMDEHARYGGVVPEIAARAHLEALGPAIEQALAEARVGFDEAVVEWAEQDPVAQGGDPAGPPGGDVVAFALCGVGLAGRERASAVSQDEGGS